MGPRPSGTSSGKPPASTLYFYVGYVDDYVDVYVKDVTTGTVTQLIDIDSLW